MTTCICQSKPFRLAKTIGLLEREHAPRRSWIWARLGHSPLAAALAHLHDLATYTVVPLTGTRSELTDSYTGYAWRADAAALSALAGVEHSADVAAISAALRAIYQPWLDQSARAFQAAYSPHPRPLPHAGGGEQLSPPLPAWERPALSVVEGGPGGEGGTCLLFCDALRYDLVQRLADTLTQQGISCAVAAALAPLPGITPTAKPAVSPAADRFTGVGASDLTPILAERGTRASSEVLRAELTRAGFQILTGDATGDPTGRAWTELGAIDSYGHQHGRKLAHHIAGELRTIERRIVAMLEAGWRQTRIAWAKARSW